MHRMRITQKGKKMNSKNQQKKKEIDWMITLVPLALIVALCIVFFFAPEQSNQVLGQIRFLFGDTFGTYYLVIGLGIFFLSLFLLLLRTDHHKIHNSKQNYDPDNTKTRAKSASCRCR